jgi:precorrin-2 methylase
VPGQRQGAAAEQAMPFPAPLLTTAATAPWLLLGIGSGECLLELGKTRMARRTISEFDELVAMIRQNINELVEQAAAYSGAEDEERTANRIAEQQQKLDKLIELRSALTGR